MIKMFRKLKGSVIYIISIMCLVSMFLTTNKRELLSTEDSNSMLNCSCSQDKMQVFHLNLYSLLFFKTMFRTGAEPGYIETGSPRI